MELRVLASGDLSSEANPLLLIHGFGSNAVQTWQATGWTKALDDAGVAWIAPDLPGHGLSQKPHEPEAYTMAALIASLDETLAACGCGNVDVLGYSFGGDLGLRFASGEPDRVGRVIAGGVRAEPVFTRERASEIRRSIETGEAPCDEIAAEAWAGASALADNDTDALMAAVAGVAAAPPLLSVLSFSGPALLFRGADDALADARQALARGLSQAEELVLPGRTHRSTLTARVLKQTVISFLGRERFASRV